MWLLYEILLFVGLLFALPKAIWRRRLPHRGWLMRLGRYPAGIAARLQGRSTVWIHAVSVGEVMAAHVLVRQLAHACPQSPVVLSTVTHSGFSIASKQLADVAIPIYFPLDFRFCVSKALATIRPQILLLVETELWPTAIRLTTQRSIPILVVNGRISPRAFRRYRRIQPWMRGTLSRVDRFLMQSELDAERIRALGALAERVTVVGSLKWEASLATRPAPQQIHTTAARLGLNGTKPLLVAGSTHRGEERLMLQALQALQPSHGRMRLILAPRHLERMEEVEGLVRQAGLTPVRLSQAEIPRDWDVGLVDTFGTLPLYYGVASVVFVGGSLIPHGGQNPLEAASLGRPIIFGPFMHNFADIAQQLLAHQAAQQLSHPGQLLGALHHVLTDQAAAQAMGRRAQELTERSQGAARRTLEALEPFLTGTAYTP